MAKKNKERERMQKYLSIADPENIDYSDYSAITEDGQAYTNDDLRRLGGVDNADSRVTVRSKDSDQLAGTSTTSPFETSNKTVAERRGVNTRELLTDPASNIITPDLRVPMSNKVASYNPLLFGTSNSKALSKSLLQAPPMFGDNEAPDIMSMRPLPAGNTIKGSTPEQRMMEAIANTNPSPQSAWKRVLSGLGRGLQESAGDFAQGNYGGAFGKIASNVVLGAVPAFNSATQYERNVAQAKERYKLEKTAEQGDLQRRKAEADIQETNERLKLSQLQRQQQTQRDALLDAARLRDDKRADADQQLRILEKLPADDPQRNEISKELATKYAMKVSPRYGIDQEYTTIFDQQSGDYIRATKDGTPVTDAQGNNIVVRPGKQVPLKQRKDEAMQKVITKYGGDAKSVARLSTENRKEEIINSLHPDFAKALRNPASTNALVLTDAQKAYDDAFNRLLKQNEAFTEALYEREADEIMRSSSSQSRGATNTAPSSAQSKGGKVQSAVPKGYFFK